MDVKTPSLIFRLYLTIYRVISWLIEHAGPLGHPLIRLAGWGQSRLVPHAYSAPNPVYVNGLNIYHTEQPLVARRLAMGLYEPETTRVLKDLLRPGMTVLDIGANVGYFSLLSAQLVGRTGVIWAFEPVPDLLTILQGNIKGNAMDDYIFVVPQAVSDTTGTVAMYVTSTATGWSSLYAKASVTLPLEILAQQECLHIPCTALDAWAATHGWPSIDLIKMDIEGAEKAALEGMVELSYRNPHLKLIIEFNTRTLQAAGITPHELFTALHACGFDRVYAIGEKLRPIEVPADMPWLLDEIRRGNGESLNLLCEKGNATATS